MATSFVHVGEHGFWSRDWIYADWLLLLAREADVRPSPLLEPFREQWRLDGLICSIGCVPGDFGPVASDPPTLDVVLQLADTAQERLEALGDVLSASELDGLLDHSIDRLFESGRHEPSTPDDVRKWVEWRRSVHGIELAVYANFYGLFRGLLTGRVKTTAASPINYWKVLERRDG
ncbi:MAG: hypothetical protein AB7N76_12835 [Planctomycetota bacterium]